jgi:hypothetical protein
MHGRGSPRLSKTFSRQEIARFPADHGAKRIRTADLLGAIQALSQLSYSPAKEHCSQDADRVEHAAISRGTIRSVASYVVNKRGVERARQLIRGRQYVLDSDWGEAQPGAEAQNAFLASHSWTEYSEWHLGLTEGAADETKARYAFVYGDFRRLHRTGLIACVYRAAEWRHKEVELAAHELLQLLDRTGPSA